MNSAVNDRQFIFKATVKVTTYYLVLLVCFFTIFKLSPDFIETLPVGGIEQLVNEQQSANFQFTSSQSFSDIAHEITETHRSLSERYNWYVTARTLFYAMFLTLLLMLPVAWVYKTIHQDSNNDHSIDETALILPSVVAGIVMIVQYSLALAFSLAGIVAGVRFRRALSDTFDTLFIFVAIGVGIAAGVKAIEIAVVITVFFNYSTLLVCAFGDGLESRYLAEEKNQKQLRKQQKERQAQQEFNDNVE